MPTNRPFVLTIAGFDPSAGAGVLADIKTFEQHRVYGFAINSGNTIQTENEFFDMQWIDLDFVLKSIEIVFQNYDIKGVKIGIMPSLEYLKQIVCMIKKLSPESIIVWDTVLKSTTAFDFLKIENQKDVISILKYIDLITPNYDEIMHLSTNENNAEATAIQLSQYCAVLLKGGHNPAEIGYDYLYLKNDFFKLAPSVSVKDVFPKHGSGCVLSSAIVANLCLKQDLKSACSNAKKYIESYLLSNTTNLGYHHV